MREEMGKSLSGIDNGGGAHKLLTVEIERPEETSVYAVVQRMVSDVVYPPPDSEASLMQRLRSAAAEHGPSLKEASRNSTAQLLHWTRSGSAFRALFVISVGTIAFLALTGMLVFTFFFFAATANAIIISLIMSIAAAGGCLAIFFACLTGIYIVALSVAVLFISTATISTIVAVLVATGWIGFFWTLWLVAKKSMDLTKHSLSMTGSAISAYSANRHATHHGNKKVSSD